MIALKNNITCKLVEQEDLEVLMNWRMRKDITKYLRSDPVLTIKKQIEWHNNIKNRNDVFHWVIREDNTPIGAIHIADIDYEKKVCNWGYWVAVKEKRSLLLAISLECSLYDYAFEHLKLDKVQGQIFSLNKGVIQLHEMCGCETIEGLKEYVNKNGKTYELINMEMKKDRWINIKKELSYSPIPFS